VIRTVRDLDGNEHPIADEDEARNVVSALHRSGPATAAASLSPYPNPERVQLPGGTWEVRCCVHDKAHGDAYMAANPSRKAHDPAARTAPGRNPKARSSLPPTKTAQRQQAEALKRRMRGIKPHKDCRRGRRRSGRAPPAAGAATAGALTIQGSQTGSQCWQTSGHIRRQRAMVCAARSPIRPRPATCSDATDAPESGRPAVRSRP
jgi:hypothetical protein